MKTVHLISNSHIDPVWLWPWQAGLDSALNTCRTACDFLDKYPTLTFTQGEAWIFQQIEAVDPELFARIRGHVATGRWDIVGWWIQPDCNAPSGFGFERQIALGLNYFRSKLGFAPKVAYNVDSFGHAATLPGYMRAAGQEFYVMMRPQEHEMTLPARCFRWRGFEGGPEVTVFRIAGGYCAGAGWWDGGHVQRALADLPDGVDDTMCFIGVGDHGGGITQAQIDWCLKNADSIPGCRLVFSTPSRFFAAIAASLPTLPLVTGELQHHAIGCYTVQRGVKLGVRQAEHRLAQAEVAVAKSRGKRGVARKALAAAWEKVCFNQFHDTLGGTCIPSAYAQVHAQLAGAAATADELVQHSVRRMATRLPDDPLQRLILLNASDHAWDGYTEIEPWLDWQRWEPHWHLLDEKGRTVPHQTMACEALVNGITRVLCRVACKPGQTRVLRIATAADAATATTAARALAPVSVLPEACGVRNGTGDVAVDLNAGTNGLRLAGLELPLPRLDLIDDPTDTWSHGIDRYGDRMLVNVQWDAPRALDNGPLLAAVQQTGRLGESRLKAEWRAYAGEAFVELLLDVEWRELRKLLKLTLTPPQPITAHTDGIPGAWLKREVCGRERPLRDFTRLELAGGGCVGIVCPDVLALDVTPERARLTLLRSPQMAWHDPYREDNPRGTVADQGWHRFRFRFLAGAPATPERLDQEALMYQRPLTLCELTRGMPVWPLVR